MYISEYLLLEKSDFCVAVIGIVCSSDLCVDVIEICLAVIAIYLAVNKMCLAVNKMCLAVNKMYLAVIEKELF